MSSSWHPGDGVSMFTELLNQFAPYSKLFEIRAGFVCGQAKQFQIATHVTS